MWVSNEAILDVSWLARHTESGVVTLHVWDGFVQKLRVYVRLNRRMDECTTHSNDRHSKHPELERNEHNVFTFRVIEAEIVVSHGDEEGEKSKLTQRRASSAPIDNSYPSFSSCSSQSPVSAPGLYHCSSEWP